MSNATDRREIVNEPDRLLTPTQIDEVQNGFSNWWREVGSKEPDLNASQAEMVWEWSYINYVVNQGKMFADPDSEPEA